MLVITKHGEMVEIPSVYGSVSLYDAIVCRVARAVDIHFGRQFGSGGHDVREIAILQAA